MSSFNLTVFLLSLILGCQDRSSTTETKDSRADTPKVKQLTNLFESIIGRQLSHKDTEINEITPLDLVDKSYEDQVDAILNSQQFIDDGFFYLHQQRMLLLKRLDASILEILSFKELDDLRLELRHLAENSDDYWEILSYRYRYLNLDELGDALRSVAKECNTKCRRDIKRGIERLITSEDDDNIKLYPYHDRCCSESAETLAKTQQFCQKLNTNTQKLFGKDFCILSSPPDNTVNSQRQNKKPNLQQPAEPKPDPDKDLQLAINTYLSLFLGVRTDEWFDIDVGKITDGNLPIVEFDLSRYLKVEKFPEDLQGIHASPFWLWAHRTSLENQHLRRARVIYHSWYCQNISPDQAEKTGAFPSKADTEAFSKYFAKDDSHATGDNNCFGCHKIVQPLANYFGKLAGASVVEADAQYGLGAKFLARPSEGFDRPGGYWQDGTFYGDYRGLAGLAKSLPAIPKVSECLVNSAWNTMLGSDLPQLTPEEVSDAINKFKETDNNYRELLKHLLLTDKATTYFTKGRRDMINTFAGESSCSPASDYSKVVPAIIKESCATSNCHNTNNIKVFADDTNSFLTTDLEKRAYQRVAEGTMPPPSAEALKQSNKTTLECYLRQQLKTADEELPVVSKNISNQAHEILEAN